MTSDKSVVLRLRVEMDQYKRELRQAESHTQRLERQLDRSSLSVGRLARAGAGLGAGWAIAGLIKDSVSLEAAYSRTMRQVAVASKAPASALQDLDDLAMKLGADTTFSAQDAAAAMLELAKGGLSPAQIEAGALKDSLTLAAAGGLELGDAANSVVNTMGAFGIKADGTAAAVAALAGAANASTADVSDMTQALSQVGTEANSTGLSVQETTAVLAALSNQGIKGSDAGTSFKTMLTLLVPQTKEAREEMARLGLSFTDTNGEFVSAEQIAGRLQDAYKGMSAAERSSSLSTVFGADGRRAANALIKEGASGIRGFIKETSDMAASQELANAGMAGTSGALEQLDGALETAKIQIGKGLAPVVKDLADRMSDLVSDGDFEAWAADAGEGFADFLEEIAPLATSLGKLAQEAFPAVREAGQTTTEVLQTAADVVTPLVEAFNSLPDAAQKALVLAAGAKTLSNRMGGLPGLAGSAGSSMVVFGGNAKKAGDDAKVASPKVAGLLGSLKGFGLAAAYMATVGEAVHDLGNISDSFDRLKDGSDSFAGSFSKTGQVTDETVRSISAAFQDGSIGKYADDLGVDLDKLAESLAHGGEQGEYVRKVLTSIVDDRSSWTNYGKEIGSVVPFLETNGEKAAQFRDALNDIASEFGEVSKKARDQALAVDENQNAFDLLIGGLGQYSEKLQDLPSKAITQILTPGAVDSKKEVLELAKAYNLTKSEVRTVMRALGFDTKPIRAVQKAMDDLDGTTATVTEIHEKIERTIKGSFHVPKGSKSDRKPSLALPRVKSKHEADGGVLSFYADGAVTGPREKHVAQIAPAGSMRVWAEPETGGEAYIPLASSKRPRSRAIAEQTVGILGGNVQWFANGGVTGRYENFQALTKSSKLDLAKQEQEIRRIEKSLREKETVGKGKNKHKRLVLRGLDRTVAELELADAKAELKRMKRENAELKNYGTSGQEKRRDERTRADQEAAEQAADDQAAADAEAAADAAERVADATKRRNDAVTGIRSKGDLSESVMRSPASVDRMLDRTIADVGKFTSVLSALKEKGAAPWLLDQLMKAGPTKSAIRLGEKYLADPAALASVNFKAGMLDSVSNTYADLTTNEMFIAPTAWNSGIAPQATTQVQITTTDISQLSAEIARQVDFRLATTATGGGI